AGGGRVGVADRPLPIEDDDTIGQPVNRARQPRFLAHREILDHARLSESFADMPGRGTQATPIMIRRVHRAKPGERVTRAASPATAAAPNHRNAARWTCRSRLDEPG